VIDEVAQACGWQGWIGCEYNPRLGAQPGGTSAGLGWLKKLPGMGS
jgi:2-dehydrotetronate isomerase